MLIAVLNKSTSVRNDQAQLMTRAVATQMRAHLCVAWELHIPAVVFYSNEADVPPGAQKIIIFENADQQGALGYHDVGPDGVDYSKVFALTTLQNGGSILDGALSVSSVLSHEACEMRVDGSCNAWWDDGKGGLVAAEVGDPVEADSYPVHVKGYGSVMVSNFIYPAWMALQPQSDARFDFMGTVPGPFTMSKGGYTIIAKVSNEGQQFADVLVNGDYPEWRTATKLNPAARTLKRLDTFKQAA